MNAVVKVAVSFINLFICGNIISYVVSLQEVEKNYGLQRATGDHVMKKMKKGQFYIAMAVFVVMIIAVFFTHLYSLNSLGSKKTMQPAQLGDEVAVYSNIKSQVASLIDNSFIDENSSYNAPDLAGFFSDLETDFARRGIDFNYSYMVDSNASSIVSSKIATRISSDDVFFHDEFYLTQAKTKIETMIFARFSGMQYYVATFKESKNDRFVIYNPTEKDANISIEFKDVTVENTLPPKTTWELFADDGLNYRDGSKIEITGFALVYFSRENGTAAPPMDISTTNYIAFASSGESDRLYIFNPSRTQDANATINFCDDGSCITQNISIGKFETEEVDVPSIGGVEIISDIGLSVMYGILSGDGVGIDSAVFEPQTEYFAPYSKVGRAVKLRYYNPSDTQSATVNIYYNGSSTAKVLNLGPNDFGYPSTPPGAKGGAHIVSDEPIFVTARTAGESEAAWLQWFLKSEYWFPKFEDSNDALMFYNPNNSDVTVNVLFDDPLATDWVYELEAYEFKELGADGNYFGPGSITSSEDLVVFQYSGGVGVGKGLQVPIVWLPSLADMCDTWIMRYDIKLTNMVTGAGLDDAWMAVEFIDGETVIHTSTTGNGEIVDIGDGLYSKLQWVCMPSNNPIDIRVFASLPGHVDIYNLQEGVIPSE